MTTWSICSIQYADQHIQIKATEEINLDWLEKQFTEKIFVGRTVTTGFLKSQIVPDKGGKVGEQYPYWHYRLNGHPEYAIAWQIIQYLLVNGWEPFSTSVYVVGDGNSAKSYVASAPEYHFRKLKS